MSSVALPLDRDFPTDGSGDDARARRDEAAERAALLQDTTSEAATTGRRWHLWILLGLTVFGGALRFAFLDRPVFWIDEGFTYWRVSGSYDDLVDILREGGFTPLNYQLYWLIGQFTDLSPAVMRAVPATAGTLMIPAMYFLARQLTRRSVALVVAAFTACSAYLVNYSHDTKMYMPAWLFLALHMACLMWWLRERKRIAWLGWVAAGLGMGGTQAVTMAAMVIEPLLLLTTRRLKWWMGPAFLLGIALIASGPLGYYKFFNKWNENIEEEGWRASGLFWVDGYNSGRQGLVDYLRFPLSAYLSNWEWPKEEERNRIDERVLTWGGRAGVTMLVLFAAGMFPWSGLRRGGRSASVFTASSANGDTNSLDHPTAAPEPWWRTLLWVLLWLVLPLYLFYLLSAYRLVPLSEWYGTARRLYVNTLGETGLILGAVVLLAAFSACGATLWERVKKTWILAAVISGVALVCHGLSQGLDLRGTGSVWVTRYLACIWPAVAIAACCLLMRLPGWPLRAGAVGLLLGINLFNAGARYWFHVEPPLDRMAADVVAAQDDEANVRTFLPARQSGFPGFDNLLSPQGRYYLVQAADMRIKPREFLVDNFNFNQGPFISATGLVMPPPASPDAVKQAVAASPHVTRLVVWQSVGRDGEVDADGWGRRGRRGRRPAGGGGDDDDAGPRGEDRTPPPQSQAEAALQEQERQRQQLEEQQGQQGQQGQQSAGPAEGAGVVAATEEAESTGEEADPLAEALGPAWECVSDERFDVYRNFSWNWNQGYRRREFVKSD